MQQKLQQFMMQKGFSSDIIQELMQDVKENQSDEDEKEAVMHQGEKLKRKYQRKYTGTELIFKIKTGLYRYGFKIGRAHGLNSSHVSISYAVFCLKKKKKQHK